MKKKSFEEQFPGYAIVPEKKSKLAPLLYIAAAVAAVGLMYGVLHGLGSNPAPMSNLAGYNPLSLNTLKNQATIQSQNGQHADAVRNFQAYFRMGGDELEPMEAYAESLNALGETSLARVWSRKAVQKNPESKAARFLK